MQKLDPYLNVDPGSMNPFQHGEVFVTNDGGETDLDIGHYERFLDEDLAALANVTTGQVYSAVIARERSGGYGGETVQVIPHITNEIKDRMYSMGGEDIDVVIHEIGGTVGDIESQPFLEAARQVRHEIGRDNSFFLHVSLVPYIGPSGELKTKPTQHSVVALRSIGIQPDSIVCRSDRPLPASVKSKISLMCDVDEEAVVTASDAPSIYDIPRVVYDEGLDAYVVRRLGLPFNDVDWTEWDDLLNRVHDPEEEISVAIVGKFVELPDAYLSVAEALRAGGFANHVKVIIKWVAVDDCLTVDDARKQFSDVDAICVPGGLAEHSIDGEIAALNWARTQGVPVLGINLGMQAMVVEFAREVADLVGATTAEIDRGSRKAVVVPVTDIDAVHLSLSNAGSRLGLRTIDLQSGSIVADLYHDQRVEERHRQQYAVDNDARIDLEQAGLVFSGTSENGNLVEFIELPKSAHPFYVGSQAHPELKSRPTRPHPIFVGLIDAAVKRKLELQLPVSVP